MSKDNIEYIEERRPHFTVKDLVENIELVITIDLAYYLATGEIQVNNKIEELENKDQLIRALLAELLVEKGYYCYE